MKAVAKPAGAALGVVAVIVAAILLGVYSDLGLNNGGTTTQNSSTESSIQGIVTGYVTAGPSQPVCYVNRPCDENMSGYSLVFTPQCLGSPNCQARMAELSPGGHYSILLPPGNYSVTGLYPSCGWMGCASAFPRTVTVEGGMQLVFNVNVDTGIR